MGVLQSTPEHQWALGADTAECRSLPWARAELGDPGGLHTPPGSTELRTAPAWELETTMSSSLQAGTGVQGGTASPRNKAPRQQGSCLGTTQMTVGLQLQEAARWEGDPGRAAGWAVRAEAALLAAVSFLTVTWGWGGDLARRCHCLPYNLKDPSSIPCTKPNQTNKQSHRGLAI